MTRDERISHYRRRIYPEVEGWLGPRAWEAVAVIGGLHERLGIKGCVAEFGVYHGRFLFLIDCLCAAGECCHAVDLFENQHLAMQAACHVDLHKFDENCARFGVSVSRLARDTLSLWAAELPPLRFLSIDGGHTAAHAFNDLVLAQELVVAGGVVALDDLFNPRWPGVAEGFHRFMDRANRRLSPVLYWQNKLWLTTMSEHRLALDALRDGLDIKGAPVESIWGHDTLIPEWPGH